jgi:hypothetical protein
VELGRRCPDCRRRLAAAGLAWFCPACQHELTVEGLCPECDALPSWAKEETC